MFATCIVRELNFERELNLHKCTKIERELNLPKCTKNFLYENYTHKYFKHKIAQIMVLDIAMNSCHLTASTNLGEIYIWSNSDEVLNA